MCAAAGCWRCSSSLWLPVQPALCTGQLVEQHQPHGQYDRQTDPKGSVIRQLLEERREVRKIQRHLQTWTKLFVEERETLNRH